MADDEENSSGAMGWLGAGAGILLGVIGLFRACGPSLTGDPLGAHCFKGEECRSGTCLVETHEGSILPSGVCTEECSTNDDCGDLRCVDRSCVPQASKALYEECSHSWDCKDSECTGFGQNAMLSSLLNPGGGMYARNQTVWLCASDCSSGWGSEGGECPDGGLCVDSKCLSAGDAENLFGDTIRALAGEPEGAEPAEPQDTDRAKANELPPSEVP